MGQVSNQRHDDLPGFRQIICALTEQQEVCGHRVVAKTLQGASQGAFLEPVCPAARRLAVERRNTCGFLTVRSKNSPRLVVRVSTDDQIRYAFFGTSVCEDLEEAGTSGGVRLLERVRKNDDSS